MFIVARGGWDVFKVKRVCGKIVKASLTPLYSWQLFKIRLKVERLKKEGVQLRRRAATQADVILQANLEKDM